MTERSKILPTAFGSTAFRIAATTVALFLVAATGIAAVLVWQTNRALTEQVLATLNSEADGFRLLSGAGRLQELRDMVVVRSRPEGPGLYYLVDSAGQKLAGNLNRYPPELAGGTQGGVFRYRASGNGREVERSGVAIPLRTADGAHLIVGRDIEEPRAFANRVKLIFLLSFGLVSLLGLAVGLGISRFVLKRIDSIALASQSIMEGDLTRRVPVSGSGDELDGLAANLNVMLDRIEGLMNGLREVSDNIAHDLKTPINRLRNAAEAALRDPEGGEDAYREGLEHTIERADELIKTFNALLLVARLEAGAVEENSEVFDLGALVRDVAELYEPAAEEAGFQIEMQCGDGPNLTANRQLIGQALANLIDNAIKYSISSEDVGGEARRPSIEIGVATVGDHVEISVGDRGPGISAENRERVLKRFVRLEESRTQPGTGLGLSLVAAVARLHRGGIRLEDNQPGLRVVVWLPRRAISGKMVVADQAVDAM